MIYPSEGGNLISICKIPFWSGHAEDEKRLCTVQHSKRDKKKKLNKTIERITQENSARQ
jgi:hypothetical protein